MYREKHSRTDIWKHGQEHSHHSGKNGSPLSEVFIQTIYFMLNTILLLGESCYIGQRVSMWPAPNDKNDTESVMTIPSRHHFTHVTAHQLMGEELGIKACFVWLPAKESWKLAHGFLQTHFIHFSLWGFHCNKSKSTNICSVYWVLLDSEVLNLVVALERPKIYIFLYFRMPYDFAFCIQVFKIYPKCSFSIWRNVGN